MALNKGIWDPERRGTNIKGTNLKSLIHDGMHSLTPLHCKHEVDRTCTTATSELAQSENTVLKTAHNMGDSCYTACRKLQQPFSNFDPSEG